MWDAGSDGGAVVVQVVLVVAAVVVIVIGTTANDTWASYFHMILSWFQCNMSTTKNSQSRWKTKGTFNSKPC